MPLWLGDTARLPYGSKSPEVVARYTQRNVEFLAARGVKAVVVAKKELDRKDVIGVCRGALAEYKIPRIVEFRDEIPRSPIGKILRSELI